MGSIHPAVSEICVPQSLDPICTKFDKFLGHGQAHLGQMGKWPWRCTTTGLDNSTELRMEKIHQAVTEIWVPQVWQPPARTVTTIPLQPGGLRGKKVWQTDILQKTQMYCDENRWRFFCLLRIIQESGVYQLGVPQGHRRTSTDGQTENTICRAAWSQLKTFYCNDHTITEFEIIDSKNSSTAYVILHVYELIDTWFLDSNRRVGVRSLPWHWHILSIPLTTGRGTCAETCGLDDVFPPDDLCSCPEALC